MIEGVIITQLSVMHAQGGDVLHAMKCSDLGYKNFGEAYFSTINPKAIKAWKRHKDMVLNIIVPVGSVRFILYKDRKNSVERFQEVILSRESNYVRLTIPPMVWFGFQGLDEKKSIILNIANIKHSSDEVEEKTLDKFEFNWN
jgi:dTDP-4-dehydrorhamnose 3,5-epimerase